MYAQTPGPFVKKPKESCNAVDYRAYPALVDLFRDRPSPGGDRLPDPPNLQITLIGWLPATIWAVYALSQYMTDQKIEKALKGCRD